METKLRLFVFRGVALLLLVLAFVVFFKFGLPALLPFLLSFVISSLVRPLADFFARKTKIKKKVWSVILIVVIVGGVTASLIFLGSAIVRELKELLSVAGSMLSDAKSPVRQATERMAVVLENANIDGKAFLPDLKEMLSGALSGLATKLTEGVGGVFSSAPNVIFFIVVMILSLFYFTCDGEGLRKEAGKYLPEAFVEKAVEMKMVVMRALMRFVKAYLSLLGITFVLLTVGFFIIRVEYPLLFAVLTSLVDILPVFGVGTVLVPWAVGLFIAGDTVKGISMLCLFFVMYAVRQVLEPRIVGNAAGVHPLLALFAVYLGFRLMGVGGMITAPLLLNGLMVFREEKKKK